jgi:hypothetical protein
MEPNDVSRVKRIVFWNPRVDKASSDFDDALLILEDEVSVVLEFPSREALDAFRARVAAV